MNLTYYIASRLPDDIYTQHPVDWIFEKMSISKHICKRMEHEGFFEGFPPVP